jgi:hypothetical protein
MATNDFLADVTTVRFMAISAFGFVIAKLVMFFPSRLAKGLGIVLNVMLLVAALMFVVIHYDLVNDARNGFIGLRRTIENPLNGLKLLLIAIVAVLSILSLFYPFTWREWRQLLTVERVARPEPAAIENQ